MVDRAAYMSFLESQLERVTASCKTVESYNARIDTIQDAMAGAETKIANNTRLVKIAQSFGEQVEDDMKKFKQVYGNKFQRLDESVSSALDIHQQMLDRIDTLERLVERMDRSIVQVEERVAFSLSKHSLHTEEMVGAMEERVMLMLKSHKEEMQSTIDRSARETRDLMSSVTEGRREELLARERFQQSLLDESRRQHDEWDALKREVHGRMEDMDARNRAASSEAIGKADAAVARLQGDVNELELRLAAEVRTAVADLRGAERRLAKDVDATMEPLQSTARDLDLVRREMARVDTERLKMRDLLLAKMSDLDRRVETMPSLLAKTAAGASDSRFDGAGARLAGGSTMADGKRVRIDDGSGHIHEGGHRLGGGEEEWSVRQQASSLVEEIPLMAAADGLRETRGGEARSQWTAMEQDLRKKVDEGINKVQQVLDKNSSSPNHHLPSTSGHVSARQAQAFARQAESEAAPPPRHHPVLVGGGTRGALEERSDTARRWMPKSAGTGGSYVVGSTVSQTEAAASSRGLADAVGGQGGRTSPEWDHAAEGGDLEERKERRRRRLKELYKELSSLEVEETSIRQS